MPSVRRTVVTHNCFTHGTWMEVKEDVGAPCPRCARQESERAYQRQMLGLEANLGKDVLPQSESHKKYQEWLVEHPPIGAVRTEGSRMPKGKETGMLDKLKRLDLERMDLDEAVYLVSIGKAMRSVYEAESLETPQWLTDNVRELSREITNRMAESREKALREVELELLALRSRDEKKSDLVAKAERLKAQLGRSTPASAPAPAVDAQ